jgi:phage/plasmid-like protein (TIGR03299 family)
MAHNIGQMFYYGQRPWHDLGTALSQPADIEEALEHGGLDWEVETAPIVPAGEPGTAIGHRVAVLRKDRLPGDPDRVVGVVHPDFKPLQNRGGAMLFDALLGRGKRIYHTGGYLKHGEMVWLLAKLPKDILVDGKDKLETYLLFSNSHDGSLGIDIRLTSVRVVCNNTLSLALNQKGTSARAFRRSHSGRYDVLKEEAAAFFESTLAEVQQSEALLTRLAAIKADDKDFADFLMRLMPDPTRPKTADGNSAVLRGWETRVQTVREARTSVAAVHLGGIPDQGIPPTDGTWWGALNTVTGWVDHIQKIEGDRYAHIHFGGGDRLKNLAMARIVEVCK